MIIKLFISIIFITSIMEAQSLSRYNNSKYREFDFWLGEWNIKQKILKADGNWFESLAKNRVFLALDSCAVIENWEGEVQFFWDGMDTPENMEAISIRSYDPKSDMWQINWIDSRNTRFTIFEGKFENGKGEFFRIVNDKSGKTTMIRITFSEIYQDSVRWELAVSNEHNTDFSTLWIMEMYREN